MGTEILVRGITFIKLGAMCVDEDLIIHFNSTLGYLDRYIFTSVFFCHFTNIFDKNLIFSDSFLKASP